MDSAEEQKIENLADAPTSVENSEASENPELSNGNVEENLEAQQREPLIPIDFERVRMTNCKEDKTLVHRRRCALECISGTWKDICKKWKKQNNVESIPPSLVEFQSSYLSKKCNKKRLEKEFTSKEKEKWEDYRDKVVRVFWEFTQGPIDAPIRDLLHKLSKTIIFLYQIWFGGDVSEDEEITYINLHWVKRQIELLMDEEKQSYVNYGWQPYTAEEDLPQESDDDELDINQPSTSSG